MKAHAPHTRTEGWAELSYLVPHIYNAVMRARYAQAALQIAKKLDAHIIITSDPPYSTEYPNSQRYPSPPQSPPR